MKQRYIIVRMNSTAGTWRVEEYREGPFGTEASLASWRGPYSTKREAEKASRGAEKNDEKYLRRSV